MNELESGSAFLEVLGVEAVIVPDPSTGNLIMIETAAYETRRRTIDAWFTRVRQIGKHSYFVIRIRGTGNTIRTTSTPSPGVQTPTSSGADISTPPPPC